MFPITRSLKMTLIEIIRAVTFDTKLFVYADLLLTFEHSCI